MLQCTSLRLSMPERPGSQWQSRRECGEREREGARGKERGERTTGSRNSASTAGVGQPWLAAQVRAREWGHLGIYSEVVFEGELKTQAYVTWSELLLYLERMKPRQAQH